jgi:hypothetical protein
MFRKGIILAGGSGSPLYTLRGTECDFPGHGDGLSTTHAESLKSLMTLDFQRFEDVSLMAA